MGTAHSAANMEGGIMDKVEDLARFYFNNNNSLTVDLLPILTALGFSLLLMLYIVLINPLSFWGAVIGVMQESAGGGYGKTTVSGPEVYPALSAPDYGEEEYGSARAGHQVEPYHSLF